MVMMIMIRRVMIKMKVDQLNQKVDLNLKEEKTISKMYNLNRQLRFPNQIFLRFQFKMDKM